MCCSPARRDRAGGVLPGSGCCLSGSTVLHAGVRTHVCAMLCEVWRTGCAMRGAQRAFHAGWSATASPEPANASGSERARAAARVIPGRRREMRRGRRGRRSSPHLAAAGGPRSEPQVLMRASQQARACLSWAKTIPPRCSEAQAYESVEHSWCSHPGCPCILRCATSCTQDSARYPRAAARAVGGWGQGRRQAELA